MGDSLVLLGAFFWSTHIIFTGIIIKKYNLPLTIGALQTIIVAFFSFIIALVYEDFILDKYIRGKISNFICRRIYQVVSFCFTNLCTRKYYPSSSSNYIFS